MATPETAYTEVERLVKKFKGLSAAARKSYNEADTRKDLILPLFHALEWDTADTAEVSAEEKVSRGWVDFSFRLSGIPRFFLETKKVSEDLTDPRWVKQAIDYAWTKSVTWALLSDFEGLRVFNAEWKEDNPLRAQFIDFSVDTYLRDFDRLWWLSRPEIAAGTLDREAEKVGKKARKQPVSQRLFDDLKDWRYELFRHLRAYNKRYSPAQIDEAVLRLLNRLIFVRAAEDRGVEPPRLLPLLRDLTERGKLAYLPTELAKLFRELDATYNSDLFAEHFSEGLDCEPGPFVALIEGLHEERTGYVQYNFNAIDADVLGTAYEQYLGHVIAGARAAEVVEKRAKRKSQGIYYTPTFVVKYIVRQTLGRYLDEHGYNPARPVRVLDMSCGSGSFLIEAFDTLDRHLARERSQAHGEREDVVDYARRMEILTQCIYGVDKDEQAVAVAKLNLSLKALHARDKLPMLENIRVGDSLISGAPEELKAAFGKDWKEKKPFNWETEFRQVFTPSPLQGEGRGGGFDVIVGNPPYGMLQPHNTDENLLAYLNQRFEVASFKIDMFHLFMERCLTVLCDGGYLGLIVPNTFITNVYTQKLRDLIASKCKIIQIVVSSARFFAEAEVNNAIVVLQKESSAEARDANRVSIVLDADEAFLTNQPSRSHSHTIRQKDLIFLSSGSWNIRLSDATVEMLRRIQSRSVLLGNTAKINRGLISGDRDKYFSKKSKGKKWLPIITGTDVNRYYIQQAKEFVYFEKPEGAGGCWDPRVHQANKIVIRQIGRYPIASYDSNPYCVTGNIFTVRPIGSYAAQFILGILNSRFTQWLWQLLYGDFKAIFPELKGIYLEQFPIRTINFDDPAEKQQHDALVALVEEMLQLQKDYAEAEREKEDRRHALKRRMDEVDAAIDKRVYNLYGLTEDEIKAVEAGTQR